MTAALTVLALLFERMFGYPAWLTRGIGHPAMWMGRMIARLDRLLNRPRASFAERKLAGVIAVVILVVLTGAFAMLIEYGLLLLPFGLLAIAILASTLLAQRSLYEHVARVAFALESGELERAREAVSHIVGRDTEQLDEAGVARAAIESLAENFSDAVVAPSLWMVVAGLPGAAIYKMVNTADSMIGHRSELHEAFGWAAARFDDLLNLPAARLTALLVVAAARFTPGASAEGASGAVLRDASRHRSPNAGYPEAAFAGALGLALAGPRTYGGVLTDDVWMGEGRYGATAADIRAALVLYERADAILIGLVAMLAATVVAFSI